MSNGSVDWDAMLASQVEADNICKQTVEMFDGFDNELMTLLRAQLHEIVQRKRMVGRMIIEGNQSTDLLQLHKLLNAKITMLAELSEIFRAGA